MVSRLYDYAVIGLALTHSEPPTAGVVKTLSEQRQEIFNHAKTGYRLVAFHPKSGDAYMEAPEAAYVDMGLGKTALRAEESEMPMFLRRRRANAPGMVQHGKPPRGMENQRLALPRIIPDAEYYVAAMQTSEGVPMFYNAQSGSWLTKLIHASRFTTDECDIIHVSSFDPAARWYKVTLSIASTEE